VLRCAAIIAPSGRAAALELEPTRNLCRCRPTVSHHGLGQMFMLSFAVSHALSEWCDAVLTQEIANNCGASGGGRLRGHQGPGRGRGQRPSNVLDR